MKRYFRSFALVLCAMFIVFSGCSEQAEMPTVPAEGKMTIISPASEDRECSTWTEEELNEYAESILSGRKEDCVQIKKLIQEDKCFRKWFNTKVHNALETGEIIPTYHKEWIRTKISNYLPEKSNKDGNEHCFNGDQEKLTDWVITILRRGNADEIINKAENNPCFIKWLSMISDIPLNPYFGGGITKVTLDEIPLNWLKCPLVCPEGTYCVAYILIVYYENRDPIRTEPWYACDPIYI